MDLFEETKNTLAIILLLVSNDASYLKNVTLNNFNKNEKLDIIIAAVTKNGLALDDSYLNLFTDNEDKLKIILAAITNNGKALNKIRLLQFDKDKQLNIMIKAATSNGLVIEDRELMILFDENIDNRLNIMINACINNALVLNTNEFNTYFDEDDKTYIILGTLLSKDNNKILNFISDAYLILVKKYFNNMDKTLETK